MKNPKFRPVHKKRERTTNYPPDKHSVFCERCFARNGFEYCPKEGRKECQI